MGLASKLNFDHTAISPPTGGVNAIEANDGGSPVLAMAFGVPAATSTTPGVMPLPTINPQSGTSYTFVAGDVEKLVLFTNASAVAAALPHATTTGFGSGFTMATKAAGSGTVTITPTTSTINGASSLALTTNQWAFIWSDGTNYFALVSSGGGGSTPNFADGEIVSGSGTSWTLAHAPSPAESLILVQRVDTGVGITLFHEEGSPTVGDYTLSGTTLTTVNSLSSGSLRAWYRY